MNELQLSFIIPVYNVEKYLEDCVYSITKQIVQLKCQSHIELILVDDGSTDNSGKLCDEWREKFTFIKVIHKVNGGLASARNAGLEIAKGRYIAFIDSDDKIAENSLKVILDWINDTDCDICFMQTIKFYPDGKRIDLGEKIEKKYVFKSSPENVVEYLATRPKYPGSSCFKLYKKLFLDNNNIKFPLDNRKSEDLGFSFDCIISANEFDVLEMPYYEYRQQREGSITNVFSESSFWDLTKFIEESIEKTTRQKSPINKKCEYALSFVAYEYIQLLIMLDKFKGKNKRRAKRYLIQYNWLLKYGISRRMKIIKKVLDLCGYCITSKLLNIYRKLI